MILEKILVSSFFMKSFKSFYQFFAAKTARERMPTKNDKIPRRKLQEVYLINPVLISRGVRILRMIPNAAQVSAMMDSENPKNESVMRNFHCGVLKNFSKSNAKRIIEPVSSVVICFI
jgi:hypothetical protein